MRISSKGRYALVSMIDIAQNYDSGKYITVISIAEQYNISKIYLEQVFSLLKRGGLVNSVKGAQGGYQLTRDPCEITVYDVLFSTETSMFEETENTIEEQSKEIENTLHMMIFKPLDKSIQNTLKKTTLSDILLEVERQKGKDSIMFYI